MSGLLPTRLPQTKTAESSYIKVTRTILPLSCIGDGFVPATTPAPTRLLPFTGECLPVTVKGENSCSVKGCFSSVVLYWVRGGSNLATAGLGSVSYLGARPYSSWIVKERFLRGLFTETGRDSTVTCSQ